MALTVSSNESSIVPSVLLVNARRLPSQCCGISSSSDTVVSVTTDLFWTASQVQLHLLQARFCSSKMTCSDGFRRRGGRID